MFTKHTLLSATFFAVAVLGKPINMRRGGSFGSSITPIIEIDGQSFDVASTSVKEFSSSHSFNNWGGLSSLSHFDDFFGSNNFCGASNVQVLSKEEIITCQATDVRVLQQQLSIISEYAKRLILTQSCETESQVVVFSQWLGGLVQFGEDLRRQSSRHVTFDSSIASHISNVCDSHGNINTQDFGFSGSEIGSHSVTIIGGNWNDQVSPSNVGLTWDSCIAAAGSIPLGVSCDSSVCQSSSSSISLPPSSSCSGSECGSSLPPIVSSGCSSSDCGASLPPVVSSGCSGSDCGASLPPVVSSGCSTPDCGSSVSSIPPPPPTAMDCPPGLDCSGGLSSLPPTVSSGSSIPPPDASLPPVVSSGSSIPPPDASIPPVVSSGSSIPPVVSSGSPVADCPPGLDCSGAASAPPSTDGTLAPPSTDGAAVPVASTDAAAGTAIPLLTGTPADGSAPPAATFAVSPAA